MLAALSIFPPQRSTNHSKSETDFPHHSSSVANATANSALGVFPNIGRKNDRSDTRFHWVIDGSSRERV